MFVQVIKMKLAPLRILMFYFFLNFPLVGLPQVPTSDYQYNVNVADSLFKMEKFAEASSYYSKAFQSFGWKGATPHRLMAAKSWAASGGIDSAFSNLFNIAEKAYYSDLLSLESESLFSNLKKDTRWQKLVDVVRKNLERKQELDSVKQILLKMLKEDQDVRMQLSETLSKIGANSKQYRQNSKSLKRVNEKHIKKLAGILKKYGWLSTMDIGSEANIALSTLIAHAAPQTREKYLPIIEKAFLEKKIQPQSYIIIKDKHSLWKTGYQIYGSQIGVDDKGGHFVLPIRDKENVNTRRAQVGLRPLEDYLKEFKITTY
ncbi:DUF6624 domain-containing protein [Sphingobacterium thalpophilum]|uniref:DUF6624 domain-containing protein n=1 Tax=Sphingobacterium thalpophilum TaxID=259 RepID=UPI003C76C4EA